MYTALGSTQLSPRQFGMSAVQIRALDGDVRYRQIESVATIFYSNFSSTCSIFSFLVILIGEGANFSTNNLLRAPLNARESHALENPHFSGPQEIAHTCLVFHRLLDYARI